MSVSLIGNEPQLRMDSIGRQPAVISTDVWKYRAKDVRGLSSEQIHEWIQDVVAALPPRSESFLELAKLAKKIPLHSLEEAVCLNDQDVLSCLQQEADYYLQMSREYRGSLKGRVVDWVSNWPHVIENFLNAFGILDFFQISENVDQVEHKRTKLMTLFPLMSMVTVGFVSGLGFVSSSVAAGGVCVSLALLSYLYSQFRPMPKYLPKAENWTHKCQRGHLHTVEVRKELIDEIARGLIMGKSVHQLVMMSGKSGIGKTEAAKVLVHAVERGDYPELKGKTVFYLNMANLLNKTESKISGNRILSHLSDLMGRHRDQIILIIDGIELAYNSDIESLLGDQLKAMMDFSEEKFPYVLGITTEDGRLPKTSSRYQDLLARSLKLHVEEFKDQEMLELLQCSLMKLAPDAIVADNALILLIQKMKRILGNRALMPAVGLSILTRCVYKLNGLEPSSLAMRVHQLRKMIQVLYREKILKQPDDLLHPTLAKEIQAVKEELKQLEQESSEIKQQVARIKNIRHTLYEIKKALLNMANDGLKTKSEKQKVLFILLGLYWAPYLKEKLRQESTRLGVSCEIDETLIDEAIREELNGAF